MRPEALAPGPSPTRVRATERQSPARVQRKGIAPGNNRADARGPDNQTVTGSARASQQNMACRLESSDRIWPRTETESWKNYSVAGKRPLSIMPIAPCSKKCKQHGNKVAPLWLCSPQFAFFNFQSLPRTLLPGLSLCKIRSSPYLIPPRSRGPRHRTAPLRSAMGVALRTEVKGIRFGAAPCCVARGPTAASFWLIELMRWGLTGRGYRAPDCFPSHTDGTFPANLINEHREVGRPRVPTG